MPVAKAGKARSYNVRGFYSYTQTNLENYKFTAPSTHSHTRGINPLMFLGFFLVSGEHMVLLGKTNIFNQKKWFCYCFQGSGRLVR